jgi:transposase
MFKFGIDWSEDHHNLCIRNDKGAIVSQIEFKHTLEGFQRFDDERRKLGVPASECLVAIETAYNLLVDFLLDRSYAVYLVPPQATRGYRNHRSSSGAHTDDSDAALLSSILHTDLNSHHRIQPNSPLTQHILAQVRLIDLLRRSIQRQGNQLRAILFRVYPQALGLFGKLTARISLQFLMAFPTAEEAQALSLPAFEAFCREHRNNLG